MTTDARCSSPSTAADRPRAVKRPGRPASPAARMCGFNALVLAVLLLPLHALPAFSTDAGGPRTLLAQNCGGYGGTECPGAVSKPPHENPDTSSPAPANTSNAPKEDCSKSGYGVAGCPGYNSKSSSGQSTTDEEAAKKLQGCGGYGANDCPKANRQ